MNKRIYSNVSHDFLLQLIEEAKNKKIKQRPRKSMLAKLSKSNTA